MEMTMFNDHIIRYFLYMSLSTNGPAWKIWRERFMAEVGND